MEIARPPAPIAAACLITLALAAGSAFGQMPPAVYRYRPPANDLVRVAEGDPRPQFADACHFQPLAGVPAIFVITVVESRSAKAYGLHAPTLVALEAGAASQNLALEAVALGLGSGMLVESETAKLAQAIGVGPDEKPFTVVAVSRPEPAPRP